MDLLRAKNGRLLAGQFPTMWEKDDIAETDIHEEDLKQIPVMHAIVNEQIETQFERTDMKPMSNS